MEIATKQCTSCLEVKDLSNFFKSIRMKDGLSYWCKSCQTEIKKSNRVNFKLAGQSKSFSDSNLRSKECSRCKTVKTLSEFNRCSSHKDGFDYYCRDCVKNINRKNRWTNPRSRENRKEEYERLKNKDPLAFAQRRKEQQAARKNKDPQGFKLMQRKFHLKRQYGLTLEQCTAMLEKQNYCCALCGIHESKLKRKLHIDHCHTTGTVRGILCGPCNVGIGFFKDNPELLKKAATYLERAANEASNDAAVLKLVR